MADVTDIDILLRKNDRGDIVVHSGNDALRNKVAMILSTMPGEIPRHANIGSFLYSKVFEFNDDELFFEIENLIRASFFNDGDLELIDLSIERFDQQSRELTLSLVVQETGVPGEVILENQTLQLL